jgi:hypothetical protein
MTSPAASSTQSRLIDPEWENFFTSNGENEKEPLQRFLGRVSIFSLLRAKELLTLARMVHAREFVRGEIVIQRGVQQSGLYLVRTGSVQIVRDSAEGGRQVIGTLGPGEMLGEFALLDDTPRSTSVVAAEDRSRHGLHDSVTSWRRHDGDAEQGLPAPARSGLAYTQPTWRRRHRSDDGLT